jgi:23S rRNA (adenine-N6)-dimethyltransferase
LEIGPGSGIITEVLLSRLSEKGKLIGVEIDPVLYKKLKNRLDKYRNLELYNKDFLEFTLPSKPFKLFSNIPFNFTSDILEKLLDPLNSMTHGYLIIQKEAFLNYAGSGTQKDNPESLKSLKIYPFYELKQIYQFRQSDFTPEPSVNIILGSFIKRAEPLVNTQNYEEYLDFIATATKDRAGEGVWKKIFTKKQLVYMSKNFGLQIGKGVSVQSAESILLAFRSYINLVEDDKKLMIKGNMSKLRKQELKLDKQYRTRSV